MSSNEQLLQKIVEWAEGFGRVRAVVLIGSQARSVKPADEYSDIDLIMFVSDPDYFIQSDDWLDQIGPWHIAFLERTAGNSLERRVLFDEARDVDFVLELDRNAAALADSAAASSILSRGYRFLVDKDNLEGLLTLNRFAEPLEIPPPSESEFGNLVQDFWYHTVWVFKKIQRGALWEAKNCLDGYMKDRLLRLLEYHARAVNGPRYDTWYSGRHIESWADPRAVGALPDTFAGYSRQDMIRALFATMDVFRQFAAETAGILGYPYSQAADDFASEWILTKCQA